MTKRDYEKFAGMLRKMRAGGWIRKKVALEIEENMIAIFEEDNPRFSLSHFKAAARGEI